MYMNLNIPYLNWLGVNFKYWLETILNFCINIPQHVYGYYIVSLLVIGISSFIYFSGKKKLERISQVANICGALLTGVQTFKGSGNTNNNPGSNTGSGSNKNNSDSNSNDAKGSASDNNPKKTLIPLVGTIRSLPGKPQGEGKGLYVSSLSTLNPSEHKPCNYPVSEPGRGRKTSCAPSCFKPCTFSGEIFFLSESLTPCVSEAGGTLRSVPLAGSGATPAATLSLRSAGSITPNRIRVAGSMSDIALYSHTYSGHAIILPFLGITLSENAVALNQYAYAVLALSVVVLWTLVNVFGYLSAVYLLSIYPFETKYPKFSRFLKYFKYTSLTYVVIQGIICLTAVMVLIFTALFLI